VAVSHSLDVKKSGTVIIGDCWWGIGQPSAIKLEGSSIMLTYTRGNSNYSAQVRSVLDLANVSSPQIIIEERPITAKGLTQTD
jgi:hypothetical protein